MTGRGGATGRRTASFRRRLVSRQRRDDHGVGEVGCDGTGSGRGCGGRDARGQPESPGAAAAPGGHAARRRGRLGDRPRHGGGDLLGPAGGEGVSFVEKEHLRGALGFVQVGGSERHGGAGGRGGGDQPPQVGAAHRVDAGGRFVEDEQPRLVEHRQNEGELLTHAARQLSHQPVAHVVEAGAGQEGGGAGGERGAAHAVGAAGELEVLGHGQVAVDAGAGRDEADLPGRRPPHAAASRRLRAGQHAQQGRLAGAVAAHDRGHQAGRDGQIDPVERHDRSVAHGELGDAPVGHEVRRTRMRIVPGAAPGVRLCVVAGGHRAAPRSRRKRSTDSVNTAAPSTASMTNGNHSAPIGSPRTMTPRAIFTK